MKRVAVLLALSLAVFVLDKRDHFNWLKSPILKIIRPIQLGIKEPEVQNVSENNEVFSYIDKVEMIKLREENKRLRELLGTKISPAWKFIPANVIKNNGKSLIIDIGSEIEVSPGAVVIGLARDKVNNGVLLGRVKEVSLMQSEVSLLKSFDSSLRVLTENGSVGVVAGDGEKINLKQVLQNQGLVEGELIISKGGDGWPGDLVVGKVEKVSRVDTEIYLKATVNELIEVDNLKKVFVVNF
ncbi:MAG: rod shape-determining protein MreC [Patescibacteria group bacterium]|nr:rod shape-determining protein MreC [Patescibacteria group bacterium]